MILIVEDDLEIQSILTKYLKLKEYSVVSAYSVKEALELFYDEIELVIIDIQLPDGNGISLCQKIREKYKTPIIFLTAKSDEDTIVEALSQGGDDYVVKPFSMKELLARIKCIQRRLNTNSPIIKTDDLYIDMNQYIVKKNNQRIEFSAIGYEILFHLISYQGTVVTRSRLAEFIENKTGNYIEDNTVTVHVKRIREKLGTYNGRSYIETIRGVGYRWRKE